jgi:hypothetical protein
MPPKDSDILRILDEIEELRECKHDIAAIKEYKMASDEKFREIKDNISKIFDKIEGGRGIGIKEEISEIKALLSKFEENINEVYERIEKIENLLEKTIKEVYELTPIVKALMNVETERRAEKLSFRKELRLWVIGFIGTMILTFTVTLINIHASNATKDQEVLEIKTIVSQTVQQQKTRDSVLSSFLKNNKK